LINKKRWMLFSIVLCIVTSKPETPEFHQGLCLQCMIILVKVCHKMEGVSDL